jgi:hypothetical protein
MIFSSLQRFLSSQLQTLLWKPMFYTLIEVDFMNQIFKEIQFKHPI